MMTKKTGCFSIAMYQIPVEVLNKSPEIVKNHYLLGEAGLEFMGDGWDINPSEAADIQYIFFEVLHACPLLKFEFEESGEQDIFEEVELQRLLLALGPTHMNTVEDFIPTSIYFLVEVAYTKSWTDCGYEYDVEHELLGYFDSNFKLLRV
jgi:hypothetical protein